MSDLIYCRDYLVEGGYTLYTSRYSGARGYRGGNGCRNCPRSFPSDKRVVGLVPFARKATPIPELAVNAAIVDGERHSSFGMKSVELPKTVRAGLPKQRRRAVQGATLA